MLPVLQIGPLSIRTPGLVLLAGLWAALEVASREGVRRGIDGNKVYNLGFYALVAGVLGARMGFVLFHPLLYIRITPLSRFVGSVFSPTPGTEVPWVGVLLAAGVAAYLIRRWQLDPLALADSFAPAFAIMGIAIGLADLLSGNMYGMETRLPWAIDLWGAARHPTQLYLALACAANLAVLLRLRSKEDALPPGSLFQVSLAILSLAVLLIEPLRADSPVLIAGVRTWQVIALGVLVAALAGFAWRAPAAQPDGGP
jgi:phosphatidylglycerol---prolipoprotein diacylglyceryl transferase